MTQQEFQQRYNYNAATDKLGEDRFGSVFRAYDNYLNQWVALTILKVNPQYESIRYFQSSLTTRCAALFHQWRTNTISAFRRITGKKATSTCY